MNNQTVHIVLATNSIGRVVDCYGAFYGFDKALDYARKIAHNMWVSEELDLDEDLMTEDDNVYNMRLTHEESDFKVIIDEAVPRDFNLIESGEVK